MGLWVLVDDDIGPNTVVKESSGGRSMSGKEHVRMC